MMKVYFWSYDIFEQYINCDDDDRDFVLKPVVRKRFCLLAEIDCVIFSVTNKFIIFNGIRN